RAVVRPLNPAVAGLVAVGSLLVVGAFLLGAGTLRDIALVLFIGMIIGTFSSVFIATPVQVALYERSTAIREHNQKVHEARERRIAEATAAGEEPTAVTGAAGLTAGGHRGQQAQPRRKSRSRR